MYEKPIWEQLRQQVRGLSADNPVRRLAEAAAVTLEAQHKELDSIREIFPGSGNPRLRDVVFQDRGRLQDRIDELSKLAETRHTELVQLRRDKIGLEQRIDNQ